jgi:hypothetical protein
MTTFSCLTDKEEASIYDPVLIYWDLTIDKLEKRGFKKIKVDSNIFYQDKDRFREIRFEIINDEIVSRTFKINSKHLEKFVEEYDAEIVERRDEENIIKLRVRGIEVYGQLVKDSDGESIEIITDWFHRII